MRQYDTVAREYARLIAPKYRPIAAGLVERVALGGAERVLEVAAGTGCLTRLLAPRLDPGAALIATDISPQMLALAPEGGSAPNVTYHVASYADLPFRESHFDAVACSLCGLQDHPPALREVFRVLRPGGQLALAFWGADYAEVRCLDEARRRAGMPAIPRADPPAALRRLAEAGFVQLRHETVRLEVVHASPSAYADYRRAFGPVGGNDATRAAAFYVAVEMLQRECGGSGPVHLDWAIVYATARRP